MEIIDKKSIIPQENYNIGRGQFRPEIVVIHIADGNRNGVINRFSNPKEQVSTHYIILKNGTIWQFVDEKDEAYGNGGVHFPTSEYLLSHKGINPNLYSISIETEAKDEDATPEQYDSHSDLIADICERWMIPIDREHIIGHREITTRKICPSPISVDRIVSMVLEKQNLKKKISIIQKLIELYKKLINLYAKRGL